MSSPTSLASRASQIARPPAKRRTTGAQRTLKAMAATGLMVVPLWSLFTNHGWLLDMWLAIAIVCVPAAILRTTRTPRVWQTWLGLLILVPWLTARFLRGNAIAGFVPGGKTWSDVSDLFNQVHTLSNDGVAPVHATPAVGFVLSLLAGLMAAFVDLIAVVGRRSAVAGVPILVIFTVVGAVTRHPVNWLLFASSAFAFLILLSIDSTDTVHEWGRSVPGEGPQRSTSALGVSGPRIAVVAVAIAALVPLVAPSRTSNLLSDAVHGGGKGSGVAGFGAQSGVALDPFAALKGQLNRTKAVPLFTVTVQPGDPLPLYLRANVLARYTARGWGPQSHDGPLDVQNEQFDTFPEVTSPLDTQLLHVHIQVSNLNDNPPVFAQPTSLTGVPRNTYWSTADQILIGSRVGDGTAIDETVAQPNPSITQLEGAPDAPVGALEQNLQLEGVPAAVSNKVVDLIRGKTTAYDKARALSDYFTDPASRFTYSLATVTGDSGSDLQDFLTNKRGYCQQFAGALAVMMRVANIPARVVLGYTHGVPDRNGKFTVTTNNAHAWVEAYFDGIGWIPFDPTPDAGTAGGSTQRWPWAGTVATQTETPRATTSGAGPSNSLSGGKLDTSTIGADAHSLGSKSSAIPWTVVGAGIAVLVLLAIVLIPATVRLIRRRRRLHAGRQGDAIALWQELSATANDLGYVWSDARTPRQVVSWLGPQVAAGTTEGSLRTLAGAVERARYAPESPDRSPSADPLVSELRDVETRLRRRRGRSTRLRARLWPASLGWHLPQRGRREL